MLHGNRVLQLILKVSRAPQDSNINLTTALNEVRHLQTALQNMRDDETVFTKMFSEASSICETNKIEIPDVRRRKISRRIDQKLGK